MSFINWLHRRNEKSVFKAACTSYELVYFGSVNQHADEHELVRGVTLSPNHQDTHYSVGTIKGYDVILLQRVDTIGFPGKPSRRYKWTILQIDVRVSSLPHVLLDAGHHDETFYAQLFTKFIRLTKADSSLFQNHDKAFTRRYSIYSPPDSLDALPALLSLDTTENMGKNFAQFDYEFFQDRLIVYSPEHRSNKHQIDHMIRAGIWLAGELEANYRLMQHE